MMMMVEVAVDDPLTDDGEDTPVGDTPIPDTGARSAICSVGARSCSGEKGRMTMTLVDRI